MIIIIIIIKNNNNNNGVWNKEMWYSYNEER